jgi:hypothetical protein
LSIFKWEAICLQSSCIIRLNILIYYNTKPEEWAHTYSLCLGMHTNLSRVQSYCHYEMNKWKSLGPWEHQRCCYDLNMSPQAHELNSWFPGGGVILGGSGNFRRWGLAGGSRLLVSFMTLKIILVHSPLSPLPALWLPVHHEVKNLLHHTLQLLWCSPQHMGSIFILNTLFVLNVLLIYISVLCWKMLFKYYTFL